MRATYILQETWPERSCRDDAGEIDPNDKAQHAGETRGVPYPALWFLAEANSAEIRSRVVRRRHSGEMREPEDTRIQIVIQVKPVALTLSTASIHHRLVAKAQRVNQTRRRPAQEEKL